MGLTDSEIMAALAGGGENRPKPFPLAGTGGTQVSVSPAEARTRREVVNRLLADGLSTEVVDQALAKEFGMDSGQSARLVEEVRARWLADDATNAQYAKSATIRRHKGHIRKASGKGAWTAVAMLEGNLMKIEGTASAVEVRLTGDVRMSHALVAVIGEMDPADVQNMIADEKSRMLLTTGEEVIDGDID